MKQKLYLILIVLAAFCSVQRVTAQPPPGIVIQAAGDTIWNTWNNCTVPDTVAMYLFGTAGGYLPSDSVTVYVAFGDGTDTIFKSSIYQNTYFSEYFPHIYYLPGIYSLLFIVTGPDGAADTAQVNNTVIIGSQCGNIAGNVYYDDNSDCMFNGQDVPIPWVFVKLLYQGAYVEGAYADVNGDYYFSVPMGFTYEVEVVYNNPNYTAVCPAGGSYTVSSLPATSLDFATNCSMPGHDLAGFLHAWGFRPGQPANIYFHWWNANCNLVSGTATLTLPAGLSYVSGTPAPSNVAGNVITYNVSPYPLYWSGWWSGSSYITVMASASLQIGDTLCVQMQLNPVAGDVNPADNLVEVCAPVRNSCDPNEKFEKHANWGTGLIAPGTTLGYTLFFQNVGNDVAYHINIVDTLDADLDPATLRITSTSHPMTVRTLGTDIIKFEFADINLPAASVNEPLSHGFISYSIDHLPGLAQGTPIDNTAYIFFDFNAPVITNKVTDVIDLTIGLGENLPALTVSSFPNPAADFLKISFLQASQAVVQLADITGKLVRKTTILSGDLIYIGDLPDGVYVLHVAAGEGMFTGKVVVVR